MPTDHRAELADDQALRPAHRLPARRDGLADRPRRSSRTSTTLLRLHGRGARHRPEDRRQDPGDQAPAAALAEAALGHLLRQVRAEEAPVVALRRILSQVALKKRASANSAERAAWAADDLLFVSNYGEGDERQISFAHFSQTQDGTTCRPSRCSAGTTCDTALHLDACRRRADASTSPGPTTTDDVEPGARRWRAAFTLRHREVITTSKELADPPGRAGPRHPRPHQDRARHRDREGPAHQADEGVPGGAGPRPRRRRLRRHVRPDHRLRPALGAHRRPAQEDGRRLRRPHAHQPLPAAS